MHLGEAAAECGAALHLGQHVRQEHHLPVAGAGNQAVFRVAGVRDHEARVADAGFAAHPLPVALPALAVGRVRQHEIELARRKRVVGQGRPFRPADQIVGRLAFALEQEIGLGDGVGFGVDLLAVEVGGDLFAARRGEVLQGLLGDRQHAAGAAGAVIEEIGPRLDPAGDRQQHQPRHQLDRVARRPVLARLLVVLLVEAAHQLLENRPHRVVVEARELYRAVRVPDRVGAEIDRGIEELLDQRAERVGPRKPRELIAELEALQDLLHIRREAVEISLEVGPELLLARAGAQIAQGKPRRVVEGLTRGLPEGCILVRDPRLIERRLHPDDRGLRRLQHGVEPPQDGHRQDHVAILAAHVEIAQHIVGDTPDKVRDPIEVAVAHVIPAPDAAVDRRRPAPYSLLTGRYTTATHVGRASNRDHQPNRTAGRR